MREHDEKGGHRGRACPFIIEIGNTRQAHVRHMLDSRQTHVFHRGRSCLYVIGFVKSGMKISSKKESVSSLLLSNYMSAAHLRLP